MNRHLLVVIAILVAALPFAAHAATRSSLGTGGYRLANHEPVLDAAPYSTRLSRKGTDLTLYVPPAMGGLARVVVFVPSGYGVDLTKRPGARVGGMIAWNPNGGYIGEVLVSDPAAHTADKCAPGAHAAAWVTELLIDEEPRQLVVFVDPTAGADVWLGGYKLQMCPAATIGSSFARLEIGLPDLANPIRAGAFTWRAFVTPYVSDVADESRTFELRSTVPLPMRLTLRGHYDPASRRAILTGRFFSPSFDVSDMPVALYAKQRRAWRYTTYVRTRAAGRYSFRRRIGATTRFFAETSAIADCEPNSPAPAGCRSETFAPVASAVVKVVPRRQPSGR